MHCTYTLQYIILQHQMAVLLKSKRAFIPNVGLPSVRQAADEDEGDGTLRPVHRSPQRAKSSRRTSKLERLQ